MVIIITLRTSPSVKMDPTEEVAKTATKKKHSDPDRDGSRSGKTKSKKKASDPPPHPS
jgi:hypothetical protein